MARFLLLFLLVSVFCRVGQAQDRPRLDTPYVLEHFSQERGLSQGTGYDIDQFDDYMWFATQDGLNRFDGYEFKVFRPGGKHSLNNSVVQALLADSKGRFWVGTGGGLNVYDKTNEQFDQVSNVFKREHLLDTVSIEKLLEDRRGNIWVMTDERGLYRIDPNTQKINSYFPDDNSLYNLCLSLDGELWVSTYQGIYRYDASRNAFRTVINQQQLGTQSLLGSIVFDNQGNLWIGTREDGVFVVQAPLADRSVRHYRQGTTEQTLSSNEMTALLRDHLGRIWIGSRTGGLSLYDPTRQTFTQLVHSRNNPRSLAENSVWSLYEDRLGIIWIGFSSHGIDKYDPHRLLFHTLQRDADNSSRSLPDNMIFRLFGQDDDLFIGTGTGGLARYSLTTKQVTPLLTTGGVHRSDDVVSNEVRVIVGDSDKKLWLANVHGLIHYDPVKCTYQSYKFTDTRRQLYVYAAHVLKDSVGRVQEIWTGGGAGLSRFNVLTKQWINWDDIPAIKAVATYTVRLMYADARQNLWLGTLGHGLIRYNLKTRKVTTFDRKNGLACTNIRSMLADREKLWIGTDCGLFLLNLNTYQLKKHYSASAPSAAFRLPNDVIYGILTDNQGYLWLSSNKGLTRFSPVRGIAKNYDRNDGLQSDEFNTNVCYRRPDGTLFFGGINGINFFKPDDVKKNTFVPPVRITNVTVLDSAYAPNQPQLTLCYDQNFIDFTFTALNFSNTDKNQYQYQLEGIDPTWVYAQHRRYANYTNLPPGHYVFRVKGSNDDGVWNEQGASIQILIEPPFWATWWFRALLIVLLLGGMYGLYRYRIYVLKSRQAHELRVSIRTQELERQRVAKELHDGVGANLAVLKMYLASLGTPNLSVEDLKTRSLSVLKASIDDIRSIIHDMHPRSLTEAGLVPTIQELVSLLNESQQLSITFVAQHVPQKLSSTVEINVFRVVQELVQNAVKHSQASDVWLTLRYEEGTLQLTYRDNGRGFNPSLAERPSGNGLVNIRQRIALLKGTCQFTSSENQGTTVDINVPV
ncbi:sensor histidine kinase [Spirosoma validum]|uniref:Histidine kinase domain-containing protein n=1 Tax=Spirosoma validum TaxID=2771355 RepID=A0A927B0Q0_9BACT|nr:sensor histidine kinase [Spirosoma validum]MBD2753410.1 hypothetical protein [Spirosoma validum]